jgi:S1-C subfamily serine protease
MPNGPNLDSMCITYQNTINSLVRVIAISNENVNQLDTLNNNYGKFTTGGGFFVIDSTSGYIVTCTHLILKSPDGLADDVATPIEDNIYVRIFPENVILPAIVIGLDRKINVALLQINLNDPSLVTPLNPRLHLDFVNSRNISIGTPIITLSHPQSTEFTLIFGINTYRPNLQHISFGIVTDNKYTDDNRHVESVTTDNNIIAPYSGGPLIDLNGKCLGLVSWSLSKSDTNYVVRGAIASNLVSQLIRFFSVNYRGITLNFPKGLLGITYKYYTKRNLISDRNLISSTQNIVEGVIIQGTRGQPNQTSLITTRDGTQTSFPVINPNNSTLSVLIAGDIITKGAPSRRPLMSIGKMNNQIPFDTLIMFNDSIDIEYRKFSDSPPYSNTYTLKNIKIDRLSGYPNFLDFRFTEIS